jgi:hypothetical protein
LRSDNLDSVGELYTEDDFRQLIVTIEATSAFLGGLGDLEDHGVAWIERRYENASLAATERWTAILTIVLDTPHDADRLRKNPLGVFVHAINWSKELD